MGYIVPPKNPESLAIAIETFIKEMLPNYSQVSEFIQIETTRKFS